MAPAPPEAKCRVSAVNVEMLVLFVIWTPMAVVANLMAFRTWTSRTYARRFAQRLEPARGLGVHPEGSAAAAVGADLMALALPLAAFLPQVDHGSLRPVAMALAAVLFLGTVASAVVVYSTGRWGRPRWAVPPAFRRARAAGVEHEAG